MEAGRYLLTSWVPTPFSRGPHASRSDSSLIAAAVESAAKAEVRGKPVWPKKPTVPLCVWLLVLVVLAELLAVGEAKPSKNSESRDGSTKAAIAVLCLLFVLCGGGIGWCLYLECSPMIWKTRLVMGVILFISTCVELGCCSYEVFKWWMAPILLFLNLWGPFDAVLRFPSLHGFDSLFSLKQFFLIILKVIAYILGLHSFVSSKVIFFSLLMFNIVGLPLMYVLALPLDEATPDQGLASKNVTDVDIAYRIFKFTVDAKERRESMIVCKSRARHVVSGVARCCPKFLQSALCRVDPQM
eukprot:CAMPEP_0206569554 /NCGR_PEP_ID=MMETSP0325_2-20121206/26508_1 /ASSEMBLY_ACC=CAM_ASM_000347 /TAXON_ID=2866 /ORGANISM="Crypthecodinium cohnii, Strain Seligo" /LENGTH=298 /DNA_ID=CAMNT_0054073167 /DNA_START=23 /DNA_END=916 /DNA_ORIENTATION=-